MGKKRKGGPGRPRTMSGFLLSTNSNDGHIGSLPTSTAASTTPLATTTIAPFTAPLAVVPTPSLVDPSPALLTTTTIAPLAPVSTAPSTVLAAVPTPSLVTPHATSAAPLALTSPAPHATSAAPSSTVPTTSTHFEIGDRQCITMKRRKGGRGSPRTITEFLAASAESAVPPALPSAPLSTLALPSQHPDASLTATTSAPPPTASLAPSPMETSVNSEQKQIAVRGHYKGIREWNTGVKIFVEFNKVFQPVGDNAKPLKSQLGIIVRDGQRIPLTNLDWTFIDDSIKEGIWAEVQRNVLNVLEGYKSVCLKTCNNMWKDYKSKTKARYFTAKKDDPELASKHPSDVLPEQWAELIAYWRSAEAQKQSRQNSMNRDKHGPSHITG